MELNKILKRKQVRIKKVCKHANPLFEKWLLEWAEEASQRHSNMKYNFQKAVASLKRYPLPLYSGKDCLLLAHFGDKICNLIDKKLEEYIDENGPVIWENYIKVVDVNSKKKNIKRKSKKIDASQEKLVLLSKKSLELECSGKKDKQYIPTYRSGSYALILALYKAIKFDVSSGFLKKNDLIDAAQKFCDTSFVIPTSGSHYTAWSSMSTLIKKNLVLKEGNPSRYSLTESGENLGHVLENYKNTQEDQNCSSYESNDKFSKKCKSQSDRDVHTISSSENEDESPKFEDNSQPVQGVNAFSHSSASYSEVNLLTDDEGDDKDECFINNVAPEHLSRRNYQNEEVLPQNIFDVERSSHDSQSNIINPAYNCDVKCTSWLDKKELKFTFIDSFERETVMKDNASVKIDQTKGSPMFLIKCKLADLLNTSMEFEFDESRTAPPGYTYAFLYDMCAPDFSSLLEKYEDLQNTRVIASYFKNKVNGKENLEVYSLHHHEKLKKPDVINFEAKLSEIPRCSDHSDVISAVEDEKNNHSKMKTKPLFSFVPNQFKIILCVDNMEVIGGYSSGKKGSKDIIINELKSNGIDFDVRKLNIGDFLWICQEKFPIGNKYREVVLPFIVERKRMDDLASSIRDGRFREQKFRLKKSGFKNLIYLVEEIGSNHLSIPLSTCEQAFSNTQIIDSFTVKVTADQRESAAYLTVMTRYLQGKFKHKTIDCVEMKKFLNEETITTLNLTGPSFEEFNNFSNKIQNLSVQDIFAKHLLQLSGNSVDKVTAIITKYPTPAILREALEKLPVNQREEILSSVKCPKSGRSVGSTISSQLAKLYTWSELT